MTTRIPQPDIFDKFLRIIGKKRGVKIPDEAFEKYGPYVIALAHKESFWKALFRSRSQTLPDGFVDVFFMEEIRNEINAK